MLPLVYILKELDGVDHRGVFKFNAVRRNKDRAEFFYQHLNRFLYFDPDIFIWFKVYINIRPQRTRNLERNLIGRTQLLVKGRPRIIELLEAKIGIFLYNPHFTVMSAG